MIISRSPLRISLGGGGTDLPSYYQRYGGFLIAGAINKYVYVAINRPFEPGISLKYSSIENCLNAKDVKHNIIREVLLMYGLDKPQLEITTIAELPSGTGLGSSGSFTTALIHSLLHKLNSPVDKYRLAELACEIELDRLKEPIGKQDQYAAAFGGLNAYTFKEDGSVDVSPISISNDTIYDLEDNLLLFFTGMSRSASEILADQNNKSISMDQSMIDNLAFTKSLGLLSKEALESGNLEYFGELMHSHWERKRGRSHGMSNQMIDEWYQVAINNGAIGGKLVGAGGGGFLMFYASDRNKLRHAMSKLNLPEVRFSFDFEGTKLVHN